MNKYIITTILLLGVLIVPNVCFGQTYTFDFPDYDSAFKTRIVSWGDTYHYGLGARSWNEVSVNLPSSGTYKVYTYFNADSGTSQLYEEYKVLIDGNNIGQTNDPNSGSGYKNEYLGEHSFTAGNHLVRVEHLWDCNPYGAQSVDPINISFVLVQGNSPDVSIDKSVDKTSAEPGDILTYTLSYENTGDEELTGVEVFDNYDEQYTDVYDSAGGSVSGGEIFWDIGDLNIGETGTITFKLKIKDDITSTTYIANIAVIDSNETGPKNSNSITVVVNVDNGYPQVRTDPATSVYENQATLNGYLQEIGDSYAQVWFQWGLSTSYGHETSKQTKSSPSSFNRTLYGLSSNTLYHFRAVTKNNEDEIDYGQDRVFITQGNQTNPPVADAGPDREVYEEDSVKILGSGYDPDGGPVDYFWTCEKGDLSNRYIAQPMYTAHLVSSNTYYDCTLTVVDDESLSDSDTMRVLVKEKDSSDIYLNIFKTVRNLSQGQTSWYNSVYASSSDILEFRIRITTNEELYNVMVRDNLPSRLIYQGNLKINGTSVSKDISSQAVNIGDIDENDTKTITFWVKVASRDNFNYGITNLINTVIVYNNETSETTTCTIKVRKSQVQGDIDIPTGITNNFFIDSLLFPLVIAGLLVWLLKSNLIGLDKILEKRKLRVIDYRAGKKLNRKIKKLKHKLS